MVIKCNVKIVSFELDKKNCGFSNFLQWCIITLDILQAHCINLDEKFAAFEAAQKEISQWMEGTETELQDIIKPTITERVSVADNSAPRIQVSSLHLIHRDTRSRNVYKSYF